MPIDSFGFLDTGHSIIKGNFPIRDFWIFTGLLVDYMSSFFLALFGNNWNSHLIHSSFMNILATLVLYVFLNDFNLKKIYIIFYCLSFSTLCYPVSGTPFAYIHAYIFSLISIIVLIFAIKNKKSVTWFILPFIFALAFLSMQTPTAYILLILCFIICHYFIKFKDFKNLKYFFVGCLTVLVLFILFLTFTKTPFRDFLYQYVLFPITIGEGRISSSESAYVSITDQLNFKRLVGDFKLIHILLLPLIFLTFKNFTVKKNSINLLNITIIFSVLALIFNQLITANQIYIFSLIPIIASVIHINLKEFNYNNKVLFLIIFMVFFSTIKFHLRYNVDRKFHDLENVDKNNAIEAIEIHQNLKKLRWITKLDQPEIEIKVLKEAINVIRDDPREKTLITHYQFISTVLDQNLNILNRWYLWDNNTHPTENHKYFNIYKEMINKKINSKNIKVIYLLGQENEILFDNVKNYFTDLCFESKTILEKKFSIHEIVKCKN